MNADVVEVLGGAQAPFSEPTMAGDPPLNPKTIQDKLDEIQTAASEANATAAVEKLEDFRAYLRRVTENKPKEYEPGTGHLIVRLSKTDYVTLRELDGHEGLTADTMLGQNPSAEARVETYAIFAIQRLVRNGKDERLAPAMANALEAKSRAKQLKLRELKVIMVEYAEVYMALPDGDELKNSFTPQSDKPSAT